MGLEAKYEPLASYKKDPDATLDYVIDWAAWLGADTISSIAVSVDSGITLSSSSNTTTTTTVWLSGGSVGVTYKVRVRVTTAASRIDDRTIEVTVMER